MIYDSEQNYQVSDEVIDQIVEKMFEMSDRHESPDTSENGLKQREALKGWARMGVKDTLTAFTALGYGFIKVTVGTFQELQDQKAEVKGQ